MKSASDKPAAFEATYSEWRLIKTRQAIQIIFEVPLHRSDEAYQVLGGMPQPGSEQWFAIARLQQTLERDPTDSKPDICGESGEGVETPPRQHTYGLKIK